MTTRNLVVPLLLALLVTITCRDGPVAVDPDETGTVPAEALSATRELLGDPFVTVLVQGLGDPGVAARWEEARQAVAGHTVGRSAARHALAAARAELRLASDETPGVQHSDNSLTRVVLGVVVDHAMTLVS